MDRIKYMKLLALDLEMNQPSGKIIQVGAAIGDSLTGEIISTLSCIINPNELLNPFIVTLTGITESMVSMGMQLDEAYAKLKAFKPVDCFMNPYTWGGGDTYHFTGELKRLHNLEDPFLFGRRFEDVKVLYRAYRMANNQSLQGGLSKAMTKFGLQFKGQKHRADDDAANTLLIYFKLMNLLKNKKD